MTTSRIYAYRWPARLVSHKPFAAESYSITPSCIWQVFFRKKNEFSFLFSLFCGIAFFLCKMHNPQAFLPVENSPCPLRSGSMDRSAAFIPIYKRRAGALPSSPSQSKPVGFASSPKGRALGSPRKLHLFAKASPLGRGGCERSEQTERARLLSCRAAASAGSRRCKCRSPLRPLP